LASNLLPWIKLSVMRKHSEYTGLALARIYLPALPSKLQVQCMYLLLADRM